jgi:hypothetical protein
VQLEGKEGRGKGKRRNDRRNFSYKNNPKKGWVLAIFLHYLRKNRGNAGGKLKGDEAISLRRPGRNSHFLLSQKLDDKKSGSSIKKTPMNRERKAWFFYFQMD